MEEEITDLLNTPEMRDYIKAYDLGEQREILNRVYLPLAIKHPKLVHNFREGLKTNTLEVLEVGNNGISQIISLPGTSPAERSLVQSTRSLLRDWEESYNGIRSFYARIGRTMQQDASTNSINPKTRVSERRYRHSIFRRAVPTRDEAEDINRMSWNAMIVMHQTGDFTLRFLIESEAEQETILKLSEALPSREAIEDLIPLRNKYLQEEFDQIYSSEN